MISLLCNNVETGCKITLSSMIQMFHISSSQADRKNNLTLQTKSKVCSEWFDFSISCYFKYFLLSFNPYHIWIWWFFLWISGRISLCFLVAAHKFAFGKIDLIVCKTCMQWKLSNIPKKNCRKHGGSFMVRFIQYTCAWYA